MKNELVDYLQSEGYDKISNIIFEIIKNPVFEHLKGISYLGSFKYVYNLNKTFSRYAHSIGTAYLISKILINNNFAETEMSPLILSGLLHDLGHIFFSHIGENALSEIIGFDHEENTLFLINRHFKDLFPTKKNFVVVFNECKQQHQLLLRSHLDCDTLNGIIETAKLLNLEIPDIEKLILKNLCFEKGNWVWDVSAIRIIKQFWELKRIIYDKYVYNPKNQACEVMFQKIIELLKPTDLLLTENQLINKISKKSQTEKLYSQILRMDFYGELIISLEQFKNDISLRNISIRKKIGTRLKKILKLKASEFVLANFSVRKIFKSWDIERFEHNSFDWENIEQYLNWHYHNINFFGVYLPNRKNFILNTINLINLIENDLMNG